MDRLVLYDTDEKIGSVTLNRPAKLNAISPELRVQLVEAFRTADQDASTSVVVLYAARTEVGQRFNEITGKDGLGAALRWRSAQFAE